MVALGSSTTAGFGVPADSSWVNRFTNYYKNQLGVLDFAYNLGVGGNTMYSAMPSSYVNVIRPLQPDPTVNVSKAVSLLKTISAPANGVVIVNFPSNGYDYFAIDEVINALQLIYDSATRTGNRCFITTTQPRTSGSFGTSANKKKMVQIKDAILARFGVANTLNFFDGMYNPADTSILTAYSLGDGTHFNSAGHKVLFQRIVAKNIFNLDFPVIGDYRSKVSPVGNWSDRTNWQVWNGSAWAAATSPPGNVYNNILIMGGHRINLTSNVTINGNVRISNGGTLSVGSNSILINGNLRNDGSFLSGTGEIVFKGVATQNMEGTTNTDFFNIKISNTLGVQVQSNQNLKGVLTLTDYSVFDADGSINNSIFKLISTNDNPAQDASVAPLPIGAKILGNVTVQRFMSLEGVNSRIFRYISSPLKNAKVANLQDKIPITGPFTGSSSCVGCGTGSSMFLYNESVITDTDGNGVANSNDGYVGFPTLTNTEILTVGRGYSMYVRGNLLTSSALWEVRGLISQANVVPISFPVTFTSSSQIANDGWNLVGNPFASTIDWNATTWTKTNIDATIYMKDNGSVPVRFAYWNGTIGTNGGSRYIAMGQGFWVKANQANPVLLANENCKTPNQPTSFIRKASLDNLLRIIVMNDNYQDETVIHLREDATPHFDAHADAWKLRNDQMSLSSLSKSNEKLSINSWPLLDCTTTFVLSIEDMKEGNYELKFDGISSFQGNVSFRLVDNYLDKSIAIKDLDPYRFTILDDKRSQRSDRFFLRAEFPPKPITISEQDGILSIDQKGNIQWYFNDQPIQGATEPKLVAKASGLYSVNIDNEGCQLKGNREFLVTAIPNEPDGIEIFPNPTSAVFFVRTKMNTTTAAFVFNRIGQMVGTISFEMNCDSVIGSFDLNGQANGLYIVRIEDSLYTHSQLVEKR